MQISAAIEQIELKYRALAGSVAIVSKGRRKVATALGSVALSDFQEKIFNKINGRLIKKLLNATEPAGQVRPA